MDNQESSILLDESVPTDLKTSKTILNITDALIKASKKFPTFSKTEKSYTGKYTKLESIQSEIIPILLEHGILVIQLPGRLSSSILIKNISTTNEGIIIENQSIQYSIDITTRIQHSSGEYIQGITGMPLPNGKSVNITQEAGMAITYAKRYAISSMLNLIIHGEDFDGNKNNVNAKKSNKAYYANQKKLPTITDEQAREEVQTIIDDDRHNDKILTDDEYEKTVNFLRETTWKKGFWVKYRDKLVDHIEMMKVPY